MLCIYKEDHLMSRNKLQCYKSDGSLDWIGYSSKLTAGKKDAVHSLRLGSTAHAKRFLTAKFVVALSIFKIIVDNYVVCYSKGLFKGLLAGLSPLGGGGEILIYIYFAAIDLKFKGLNYLSNPGYLRRTQSRGICSPQS